VPLLGVVQIGARLGQRLAHPACAGCRRELNLDGPSRREERALQQAHFRRFVVIVRRLASIVAAVLVLGLPAAPAVAQPSENACIGQALKAQDGASNLPDGQLTALIENCQAARHLRF